MIRYVLLQTMEVTIAARPQAPPQVGATPAPAKTDATAKITDVDVETEPVTVTVTLEPFDPAANNPLSELRVVFLPAKVATPADVSTLVDAPGYPADFLGVADAKPGDAITFELKGTNPGTDAVAGSILLIGGYDATDPDPAASAA